MAIGQFTIIPVGSSVSISDQVAEVVKIIDASGMKYEVNAMGTVVQDKLEELFDLFRKCHAAVAHDTERVFSTITIDERRGTENPMEMKVKTVEKKLGKKLK